ncbi:hypothetical protein NA56DRAFT_664027 [Hyaloscypha hepaticicola]|uniref:Uncharacterized protein n=1 Tax=Hyaloscypha hepaticicola TaxID=2082293 RepID=A0A2J6PM94_9HELO|nr:hypothetical protein NA56DRAFT_664027 [Hyaloscypha hepaticicola]
MALLSPDEAERKLQQERERNKLRDEAKERELEKQRVMAAQQAAVRQQQAQQDALRWSVQQQQGMHGGQAQIQGQHAHPQANGLMNGMPAQSQRFHQQQVSQAQTSSPIVRNGTPESHFSMAYEPAAHREFAYSHVLNCPLHDNEKTKTCSGLSKRGNLCPNKAIVAPVPGTLPMCKIHRNQLKVATFCRAQLSCGYECGRLCEWRTHMFQMCQCHQDIPMTCYFLKIPMEMRLRIYRFLLPDRRIPARRLGILLREDGEKTCMEILRINRQIHDEASSLLYGTGSFNIEVSANGLNMCSKTDYLVGAGGLPVINYGPHPPIRNQLPPFPRPGGFLIHHTTNSAFTGSYGSGGNHQLQDYQMQLMLLEQQNKKRLMMARQEQDNMIFPTASASSSNIPPPAPPSPPHPPVQLTRYPTPSTPSPSGPVWDCPIAAKYFNQIHHFHITILFPSTFQLAGSYPLPTHTAEATVYEHSDRIHALIGRLLLLPHPISTLNIRIKFADTYAQRSEAIYASQSLLRPFRRLSRIVTPEVSAIKIMSYQNGPEIDILPTLGDPSSWPDGANLLSFLVSWMQDLKGEVPVMPVGGSRVFDAYWRLEAMVKAVQERYRGLWVDFGLGRLDGLLSQARMAREAGDEEGFLGCWERVVETWLGFLEGQRQWLGEVEGMVGGIYGVFERGEREEFGAGVGGSNSMGGSSSMGGSWNGNGKGKAVVWDLT